MLTVDWLIRYLSSAGVSWLGFCQRKPDHTHKYMHLGAHAPTCTYMHLHARTCTYMHVRTHTLLCSERKTYIFVLALSTFSFLNSRDTFTITYTLMMKAPADLFSSIVLIIWLNINMDIFTSSQCLWTTGWIARAAKDGNRCGFKESLCLILWTPCRWWLVVEKYFFQLQGKNTALSFTLFTLL